VPTLGDTKMATYTVGFRFRVEFKYQVPASGEAVMKAKGPRAVFCNIGQASGLRGAGASRGGRSG
jgi:hypothetical protein